MTVSPSAAVNTPLRHLPNLICILRMLLVAPIVLLLLHGDWLAALLLIGVAGFSDGLDGFLAKRFGWQSRLGSMLDPAADKLLLVALFVTLTWLGLVPLWLTALVVLRDVLISGCSLAYNALVEPLTAQPSLISKFNTVLQLAFVLAVITLQAFGWPPALVVEVLGAGVFVTLMVSGFDYIMTWTRRTRRTRAVRRGA
ncbi:MAG: CDP-alcohol phosphatidyltransferase family protein [Gammaproteobacteria bacterium]|nr:CDP-alcohol phosphatidyltransferase family protein [Gammaproteobacteria bacterium]TVQ46705.1 MAG: CDP-alcohol phosphatidyltransferase family protein [Gammaproteobacteria bacterium]